jgi:hypothetical protein
LCRFNEPREWNFREVEPHLSWAKAVPAAIAAQITIDRNIMQLSLRGFTAKLAHVAKRQRLDRLGERTP